MNTDSSVATGDTVLASAIQDLVVANRILANEGIVDAYGHVSIRHPQHPDRYIVSRARAPELVEEDDLLEFALDGTLLTDTTVGIYTERYIHGGIYEARPDVMAVCHNHATSVLPFAISKTAKLQAVFHTGSFIGGDVPNWDIADEFGTSTQIQVQNMDQSRSLARMLGSGTVILMRGHGSTVVGSSVRQCVFRCIWLEKNARVQLEAMKLGDILPLNAGEIEARQNLRFDDRAWESWSRRAGF